MKVSTNNKNEKKFYFSIMIWGAILIYLIFIFLFSSQSGVNSNVMSKKIVYMLQDRITLPSVLHQVVGKLDLNLMIRKCTHFTEYFILAVLFHTALRFWGVRLNKAAALTISLCLIYASVDEYHQSFVSGRTPSIRDVAIDVCGSILAILLINCFRKKNVVEER